jgi:hypothetical protein
MRPLFDSGGKLFFLTFNSADVSTYSPGARSYTRYPFRLLLLSHMRRCNNQRLRVSHTCSRDAGIDLLFALVHLAFYLFGAFHSPGLALSGFLPFTS